MIERYRQMDITTASPVVIVARLYDAAIRNAREAKEHLAEGRIAPRAKCISKSMAIVAELQGTLDLERGGEIAQNLERLYPFVLDRLVVANVESSVEALDEAIGVLTTLQDAWSHVVQARPDGGAA